MDKSEAKDYIGKGVIARYRLKGDVYGVLKEVKEGMVIVEVECPCREHKCLLECNVNSMELHTYTAVVEREKERNRIHIPM